MFSNRKYNLFKHWRTIAGCGIALLATATPFSAQAKIDLVTLPNRDKTELSIYKSEDLTLVRETRRLTFNEGSNQIQFSWANTQIDPTSLQMRLVNEDPDYVVLDAYYPANTQNTIVWNVDALSAGNADVEITYFASGLSWTANYVATANAEETSLTLEPTFKITNYSGEDFVNATTRLVVGEINLEEAIATLAARGIISRDDEARLRKSVASEIVSSRFENTTDFDMFSDAMPTAVGFGGRQEAAEIIKQAVSEYYLYTIEGTEDLETGWGKQLPNPTVEDVEFDLSYEYNPNKYGRNVIKFYKFKNNEEANLGDVPLPAGNYYIYSGDGKGSIKPESQFNHKYVPVGEDVELNLGSDGQVLLEERVMERERLNFEFASSNSYVTGYDIRETIEIEIRNSKKRSIPFKLTRPMTGDWEIDDESDPFKKVDQTESEWEFEVPAQSKKVITFELTTRTGTRARN